MKAPSRRAWLLGFATLAPVPALAAIDATPSASGSAMVYTGFSRNTAAGVAPSGRPRRGRKRALWELQLLQPDGKRLVFRGMREPSDQTRVLRFSVLPDP